MAEKKALVVLGVHRSGTSAVTGVLAELGVVLGDQLLPALDGVNEKGFFEHAEIVAEHEVLLGEIGYSWSDLRSMPENWWQTEAATVCRDQVMTIIERDFSGVSLFGLKDPRLCRLLPLWLDIFTRMGWQPKVILCFRHPLAVVRSLMARDQLDFHSSLILWFRYVLEAEQYSRGLDRSVVVYDTFLTDWQACCERLEDELGIVWPKRVTDCAQRISAFLDNSLNHGQVDEGLGASRLLEAALRLYESVQNNVIDRSVFDAVKREFLAEMTLLSPYLETLSRCQDYHVKVADLERRLQFEKKNAQKQIEYRDALVADLKEQLAAEKANAKAQIVYRDALVADLKEQLAAEKANAKAQIVYRDALVADLKEQLAAEKANAKAQIEYRDALIKLLEDERDIVLGSRKELLKRVLRLR